MPSWDAQSTALSWVLAGVGVALTVVAALVCHSSATTATVCLVVAALTTVQLLGFAATCFSYRFWLVTSVGAPRLGPGQQQPRIRRGLPSLKSSSGVLGLDSWSVLVIGLVALPVVVPLLTYYSPSEHLRWTSVTQAPIGATVAEDFNNNGATDYTVGAYESITLSLQSTVDGGGVSMVNTASVAIDSNNKRVIMPSRIAQACKHEAATARKLRALVATYECNSKIASQPQCTDYFNVTTKKDFVCVYLTATGKIPQQFMQVVHKDMQVNCSVTFSLAHVDITWRGRDRGRSRICQITDFTVYDGVVEDNTGQLTNPDLVGNGSLVLLTLPLTNSFMHTVSHEKITKISKEGIELFYGSIFAAAITIRAVSTAYDPTNDNVPVKIRFAHEVCQRYGWSGLVIFLLGFNVLLAIFCTIICSGMAMQQLSGLTQDTFGTVFCFCFRRRPMQAVQAKPDDSLRVSTVDGSLRQGVGQSAGDLSLSSGYQA